MAEIRVEGLEELGRALKEFPEVLGQKYLKRATYTAAELIREDAETCAPVRTGAMRDAIAVFKRPDDPSTAHYAIGVRRVRLNRKIKRILRIARKGGHPITVANDAFYWRFVEFGTSKMQAKPFLRPAFEAKKEDAVEVFRVTLADGVLAAAAEVAG